MAQWLWPTSDIAIWPSPCQVAQNLQSWTASRRAASIHDWCNKVPLAMSSVSRPLAMGEPTHRYTPKTENERWTQNWKIGRWCSFWFAADSQVHLGEEAGKKFCEGFMCCVICEKSRCRMPSVINLSALATKEIWVNQTLLIRPPAKVSIHTKPFCADADMQLLMEHVTLSLLASNCANSQFAVG